MAYSLASAAVLSSMIYCLVLLRTEETFILENTTSVRGAERDLQVAAGAVLLEDEGGGLEGGCDLGVQLDGGDVVAGEPVVPLFAALLDPRLEGRADERVDDAADVAAGHLAYLPHDGKGIHDLSVAEPELEDMVQGEQLVLGYGDDLDVLAGDGLQKLG